MVTCNVRATVENADDGQGWVATVHLPAYPICTCGPPMETPEVVKIIQRTVRGFFTACARAGVHDGTPANAMVVVNLDVEFKKP